MMKWFNDFMKCNVQHVRPPPSSRNRLHAFTTISRRRLPHISCRLASNPMLPVVIAEARRGKEQCDDGRGNEQCEGRQAADAVERSDFQKGTFSRLVAMQEQEPRGSDGSNSPVPHVLPHSSRMMLRPQMLS